MRFYALTIMKLDKWMHNNASIVPPEVLEAWEKVKGAVDRLFLAAQFGAEAEPSLRSEVDEAEEMLQVDYDV
jgi:predicted thioredoxin/glutaredoxin